MSNPRLITLSTSYTTTHMRLGIVALLTNPGSRGPKSTFSPKSGSTLQRAWNRGRRRFQILQRPLPATPKCYSSTASRTSQPPMQKRMVGSEVFLASWS